MLVLFATRVRVAVTANVLPETHAPQQASGCIIASSACAMTSNVQCCSAPRDMRVVDGRPRGESGGGADRACLPGSFYHNAIYV